MDLLCNSTDTIKHMPRPHFAHLELHRTARIGWLRAAVLGANDGIVSTASLMVGVAAASNDPQTLLLTGVAALVAGAMSMAAGEYVSVSSQADTEAADIERERVELASNPEHEARELAGIYQSRGLSPELADQVATQLMLHDAVGAHARDELGISPQLTARPIQAAMASAATFAAGSALPLLTAFLSLNWLPTDYLTPTIAASSLAFLIALGAGSARAGGAPVARAAVRVAFWGALAMGITALAGKLFGIAV